MFLGGWQVYKLLSKSVAYVLLLILNINIIYIPAPWLLAAGEGIALRRRKK
jgi:hypothetical protein